MSGSSKVDVAAAVAKVKQDKQKTKKAAEKKAAPKSKAPKRDNANKLLQSAAAAAGAPSGNATPRTQSGSGAAAGAAQQPAKRQMPLQQRLKLVHDHARSNRGTLTFDAVTAATNVQIAPDLLAALQRHARINVDADAATLEYAPELAVHSREHIAALLRTRPFGVLRSDVADAYAAAGEDVTALVADGEAFEVDSGEKPGSVLYPNLTALPGEPPDESTRDALLAVHMPKTEADMDRLLAAAGIAKAKRSTARLKQAVINDDKRVGRPKKARKLRNVTNAHMAHLFEEGGAGAGGAHDRID